MTDDSCRVLVTVMAHNEERRIAACLDSLPLDDAGIRVVVVVNGSRDGTAGIVRGYSGRGVELVEYAQGGKARSWSRFILDEAPEAETYVFVDGDAELEPGSVAALERCLSKNPQANAAAAPPMNGRNAAHYRRLMAEEAGLFGDCYALRGEFVDRLRASGIRLPDDLIGDDGLIAALAHTDIGPDADWRDERVVGCLEAGFYCAPNPITSQGLRQQASRMTNYALREYQNRIITAIMRESGPRGLPRKLVEVYPQWLGTLRPRLNPLWYWFDRRALARMRLAVADRQASA
jgi:glycosyltransferase involved in cell wall biosynthesis